MARLDTLSETLKLDRVLKDSVVVITGAGRGIGWATVQALSSRGAKVVFGDILEPQSSLPTNCTFLKADVTKYNDILALFKHALWHHGHVDHAISNAGIAERPGWFDPSLGIAGVESPPDMLTEEVDLRAVLWFSHIAVQYLSHGTTSPHDSQDRSLTLVSSKTGFKETVGAAVYQASKHGVLGIMRSLRNYLPSKFKPNIRINTVCPGGTDTPMVAGIKEHFSRQGGPQWNSAESLAQVIVAVTAAGKGSQAVLYDDNSIMRRRQNRGGMDWDDDEREARGMSGRSWYVVEGQAWDIEEGLDRTEDLWMGKEASDLCQKAQAAIGVKTDWNAEGGAKGDEQKLDVLEVVV
ncbi:hypothetical protein H2204_010283 [Knufia peltigerae]|uniref:Uncharacterized protein n=1 Tax=Knufia peltigerae TaxID=1002370 RepID=A0AA38XWF5_9EURO|nr:hypothetical protein H2204_010283 [Knufia peltigerae]